MHPKEKLKELGLSLPGLPAPIASYISFRRVGNVLYLSGAGPTENGEIKFQGKVGKDISLEEAYEAASLCCLNHLAQIEAAIGDLDKVHQIIKLEGYVNCAPGFNDPPAVINGASNLLIEVFGERGRHSRAAMGISELWNDIPVETILTVEITSG